MKAQQITTTIVGTLWTLMFAALVAAQQPAPEGEQKLQSQQHGEKMSMDDMMKECRTHCQETMNSTEQLMTKMEEAKQSNEPGQMRAALDEAQKPLAAMKDHMTKCMNMMSMMKGMHSGMGGPMMGEGSHMGVMMQEKEPKSGTESR